MKTTKQIIEMIRAEIKEGKIASVRKCRDRIEELCEVYDEKHNMFSIAWELGVA